MDSKKKDAVFVTMTVVIAAFMVLFAAISEATIPPGNHGGNVVRTKGGGAVSSVELDGGKVYWDEDQDSYSYASADNVVDHVVDGGVVMQCKASEVVVSQSLTAEGNIYLAQDKALIFDTDLDTWIETDNTDDQLTVYVDGGAIWKAEDAMSTFYNETYFSEQLYVAQDKYVFFDTDKDTLIGAADNDDRIYFYAGNVPTLVLTSSQIQVRTLIKDPSTAMYVGSWGSVDHGLVTGGTIFGTDASGNSIEVDGYSFFDESLYVTQDKKIYFDTDADTYITADADDILTVYVDGGSVTKFRDGEVYIPAGGKITLGDDDTYIQAPTTGDPRIEFVIDGGNEGMLAMNAIRLAFDADLDTHISNRPAASGGVDDTIYFVTGSTIQYIINNDNTRIGQPVYDPSGPFRLGGDATTSHSMATGSVIIHTDASGNSLEVDGYSFFDESLYITQDKKIYFDADADTYITSDSGDTFKIFTDGGEAYTIDEVNAAYAIPLHMEDNKVAFDIDDDTYIEASADDVWDWYVGGDQKASLTTNTINLKETIALDQDEAIFLDTDQDTYLTTDNTDDQVNIVVDGGTVFQCVDEQVKILSNLHMNSNSILFDADQDTQIRSTVDDVLTFQTGIVNPLVIDADDMTVAANIDMTGSHGIKINSFASLYLDDDEDSRIFAGDDVIYFYTNNAANVEFNDAYAVFKNDVRIEQDENLVFDSDLDTYISTADTDDNLQFYIDGGTVLKITDQDTEITGVLDVNGQIDISGTGYPIFSIEREVGTTNSSIGLAEIKLKTTVDMGDGHGPKMLFIVADDTESGSAIGYIGARRNGADNSGRLVFGSYFDGGSADNMMLEPTGELSLKGLASGATAQSGYVNVYAKTDDKLYAKDDSGNEYKLTNDSFTVTSDSTIAETIKLTFDTDGDTHISAPADDQIALATGGDNRIVLSNSAIYLNDAVVIPLGENIYLDGDNDSGIYCPSDDVLRIRTNSITRAELNTTKIEFNLPVNFAPDGTETGVFLKANSESVDDEATIALPDATTLWGELQVGDDEEYAYFGVKADGTVTLRSNSANVVNTDTDTKFCIYDSGTGATIKNRLGSAKTVRYKVHY